jgi:translation initiation factor 3 subunit C
VKEAPAVTRKKTTATEEDDDEFTTVGKGGKAMQFTADSIFKNLQLVQEARGKKVRSHTPYPFSAL